MHTDSRRAGRPRSEHARAAVLHAVDDLLVETGYAAMTMKSIAERAGVGRQTVYRWWSTKAEILFEAVADDARDELVIVPTGDSRVDLRSYVEALTQFLTMSTAGAAYRALLGEAQHDHAVAALLAGGDVLLDTASAVIGSGAGTPPVATVGPYPHESYDAAALLTGPVLVWILTGQDPAALPVSAIVDGCLHALGVL